VLSDIGGQAALTNPITGTGTTNYVAKFTGTTTLANSLLYDDEGKSIGIGTLSPQSTLHVQKNANNANIAMFKGISTNINNVTTISVNNGLSTEYGKQVKIGAVAESASSNTTGMALFTSPTSATTLERVRISSVGNVGIGTTSPSQKLDVNGSIAISKNAEYIYGKTSSGGNIRLLGINAGNVAYVGAIDSGPTSTIFNASSTSLSSAFYTAGTERMHIDGIGNVGIGTTTPTYKLDVDGTGRFDDTVTAKDFIQDGDIAKTTISTASTITDEGDLFYKVKTGRLIVQSFFEALTTASSQVIATLPIGARPETDRSFVVLNNNNSFGGVGTIQTNGNIIMNLTNGEVYILDFELTLDF
jgi:hypothetical protein